MIQEIAPKSLIMLITQKVRSRMILCLFFVDMGNRMTGFCARLKMEKLCFQPMVNWGEKHLLQYLFSIDETCYFLYMSGGIYQQVYLYRTFFLFPMNQFESPQK